MRDRLLTRRGVIESAAAMMAVGAGTAGYSAEAITQIDVIASATVRSQSATFRAHAFGMVGVFDIDWLLEERFTRLLDNMAASPGAFGAVRFFGALNSGLREDVFPRESGGVWQNPDKPIDLSATLLALEALTIRGIVPFVPLTFFPRAVSGSPVVPPPSTGAWQSLVRAFLHQCVDRFGEAQVARWWFEVWNEPNMPPFWGGDFNHYLDLYRATSEAVVSTGFDVRLGGPAIAYLPDEGAGLIERFLQFLHLEPAVKCDFISFHRKGIWGPQEVSPILKRSVDAARDTAAAALRINPGRFRGMWIINNEADMKVGFDTPFTPRMTEQFASWLTAQAVAYSELESEFAESGMRFMAASDNANQHLIRTPFDGRRSIMTKLGTVNDLAKLPAYNFYELLRLIPEHLGEIETLESVYPSSELYHLVAGDADRSACLLTIYPTDGQGSAEVRQVRYRLRNLTWPRVNVAIFRIDATHSNASAAAGGSWAAGVDPETARRIRNAQELAVMGTIEQDVAVQGDTVDWTFSMTDFATVLIWITPVVAAVPEAPRWLQAEVEGDHVVLRWTPNVEPWFYSYELRRVSSGSESELVSPTPLRAAMWIDAPSSGKHRYELSSVSASGVRSEPVVTNITTGGAN